MVQDDLDFSAKLIIGGFALHTPSTTTALIWYTRVASSAATTISAM